VVPHLLPVALPPLVVRLVRMLRRRRRSKVRAQNSFKLELVRSLANTHYREGGV
jgi:hypothetical protein